MPECFIVLVNAESSKATGSRFSTYSGHGCFRDLRSSFWHPVPEEIPAPEWREAI